MASINPHRFRLFPHRGFDAQLSTCNQGHLRLHTEFVPAERSSSGVIASQESVSPGLGSRAGCQLMFNS